MTLMSEADQLQELLRDLEALGCNAKRLHKAYDLKSLQELLNGLENLGAKPKYEN